MIDFNLIDCPRYNTDAIEKIIAGLPVLTGNIPPVDVELVAEKLGFNLIPSTELKKISGADAFLASGLKEIIYDETAAPVRIRFSIAHELGHYYLHQDIIKKVRFSSYPEWREQLNNIPGWFWGTIETQANIFAGKLIAPKSMLTAAILCYKDELLLAKKHTDNIEAIREYLAVPLAKRFDVSQDVIRFRLINENINPYDYI